jgi:hypothetical protein
LRSFSKKLLINFERFIIIIWLSRQSKHQAREFFALAKRARAQTKEKKLLRIFMRTKNR